MNLPSILLTFLPLLSVAAGFLLKKEVDRKYILELENKKHELQKKIEEEKNRQLIRFKAELIAELLAVWASNPEDLTKLNQLSYQAFLWLPDDIALDLSNLLSHAEDSKSVPALVAAVRKHLLGKTDVTGEHIVSFVEKKIRTAFTQTVEFNFGTEIVPMRGDII
jgi:hypothetical protein